MNQGPNAPIPMQEEIWRQYQDFAYTARRGKSAHSRIRFLTLVLGLLGAALGTASGQVGDPFWAKILGVAAAVAVATAGFVGHEFLFPDQDPEWSRARILAEALKREVWLSLMRVPPYDGPDPAAELMNTAQRLVKNVDLRRAADKKPETKPLPQVKGPNDYLELRLDDQIHYYTDAAMASDSTRRKWRVWSIVLGGVSVVLGVSTSPIFSSWIAVVTTASAAILAHLRSLRVETLVPLYQEVEHQLSIKRAYAKGSKVPIDPKFVLECEEIMRRENQAWRAEWLRRPEPACTPDKPKGSNGG